MDGKAKIRNQVRRFEERMSETYGCGFLLRAHIPQHDARTATQRAKAAANVIHVYIWYKKSRRQIKM